jgi:hypothetical protein
VLSNGAEHWKRYNHGVADAKLSGIYCAAHGLRCSTDVDKTYIHQPGKGFAFHTTEFVNVYIKGWCLTHHGGGIEGNDDPEPTLAAFDCDQGLSSVYPSPIDWPSPYQIYTAPQSKNATADFISGLEHGKTDVKDDCNHSDGCHWWILIRGNGFIYQTQDFIRGYVYGFCSDPSMGTGGGRALHAEQADITCDDGPNGARWALPGSLDSNNTTFWTPKLAG